MNPAARPHRLDRLRRAWDLVTTQGVEILGDGYFKVRGRVEPFYYVNLNGDPPCYCLDMEYRERLIKGQCKHVIAAKLTQLDPLLLDSMADMMAAHEHSMRRRQLPEPVTAKRKALPTT